MRRGASTFGPSRRRMDFSDIERILDLVRQHDLAEFELEKEGLKLRVRKAGALPAFSANPHTLPVGAPAFVEVGQRVKKDQVLCIIEAMKLMNEITSEYEGEIVTAYVENGKPVQYGERLFAIKTA